MTDQYAKLAFPFEANFIPRKGRKVRLGLFMGSDLTEIREAATGETVVAFRVHYSPVSDYCRPFEILAFDDKYWWPLTKTAMGRGTEQDDLSRAALLNELATCELDPLGLLPQGADRPPAVEERALRYLEPGRRDAALAHVQRKILRNFLLYQDRAYVLGGEPILRAGEQNTGVGGVASSGADRTVYPGFTGFPYPPGAFLSAAVQQELRTGNFFAANDHERLGEEIRRHGPRQTIVEVLAP
jgi:hypothetical protein